MGGASVTLLGYVPLNKHATASRLQKYSQRRGAYAARPNEDCWIAMPAVRYVVDGPAKDRSPDQGQLAAGTRIRGGPEFEYGFGIQGGGYRCADAVGEAFNRHGHRTERSRD